MSLEEQKLLDDKELDELEANLQRKMDKYQNLVTTNSNPNVQSKSSVSQICDVTVSPLVAPDDPQRGGGLGS